MKKIFGLITICSILALPVIAATPANFGGNSVAWSNGNNLVKPIPATDIHLVKKLPLPPVIGEIKGSPHENGPPGKNKNGGSKEKAATGTLGSTVSGTKYAIIIGICDYPGTNHDLCTSNGDSLRMYKALTTLYGYDTDNIYLFKDMGGTYFEENSTDSIPTIIAEKPTRKNILDAINAINASSTSLEDEVVFFFSGHGADGLFNDGDNERRDEGIVVHNNDSIGIAYIWDGELKTAFTGFATTRIAFVFDTCLAGGMNDLAAEGRVISMGTSETSVSYVYSSDLFNLRTNEMDDVDGDGQPDGEGVFTHYFVNEGMLQGLADGYNQLEKTDSNVAVEEAFDYAKQSIENSGRWKRQKPTISDKFTNDLLL